MNNNKTFALNPVVGRYALFSSGSQSKFLSLAGLRNHPRVIQARAREAPYTLTFIVLNPELDRYTLFFWGGVPSEK